MSDSGKVGIPMSSEQASGVPVPGPSTLADETGERSVPVPVAPAPPSNGPQERKNRAHSKFALRILNTWLEDHKHNAYPSEVEKVELCKRTDMTLVQVNNWFINARRRVLPKMIGDEGNDLNQGKNPNQGKGPNHGKDPNQGKNPNRGKDPNRGKNPNQGNDPNESKEPSKRQKRLQLIIERCRKASTSQCIPIPLPKFTTEPQPKSKTNDSKDALSRDASGSTSQGRYHDPPPNKSRSKRQKTHQADTPSSKTDHSSFGKPLPTVLPKRYIASPMGVMVLVIPPSTPLPLANPTNESQQRQVPNLNNANTTTTVTMENSSSSSNVVSLQPVSPNRLSLLLQAAHQMQEREKKKEQAKPNPNASTTPTSQQPQ